MEEPTGLKATSGIELLTFGMFSYQRRGWSY